MLDLTWIVALSNNAVRFTCWCQIEFLANRGQNAKRPAVGQAPQLGIFIRRPSAHTLELMIHVSGATQNSAKSLNNNLAVTRPASVCVLQAPSSPRNFHHARKFPGRLIAGSSSARGLGDLQICAPDCEYWVRSRPVRVIRNYPSATDGSVLRVSRLYWAQLVPAQLRAGTWSKLSHTFQWSDLTLHYFTANTPSRFIETVIISPRPIFSFFYTLYHILVIFVKADETRIKLNTTRNKKSSVEYFFNTMPQFVAIKTSKGPLSSFTLD